MISIKELHAGDGYRYLLNGIADGEGVPGASPVTNYYQEAGNPPGQWLGSGLSALNGGDGIERGNTVSEQQMERLFRNGEDPVTGRALGRRFRVPRPLTERISARVAHLPDGLPAAARNVALARIEAEEKARKVARPVAGFDLTFSPPKSVSVVCALADQGTREQIYQAHRAAVNDVIATLERDAARTRIGTDGVAQVETRGVIATAFDHWDSRAGDPQLHTHVVVANRAQGPDGTWRTLDSRGALFPAAVALSELYDNLLADHVTRQLGLGWATRGVARTAKNVSWEIDGVPDELIAGFSTRGADIEREKDRLIEAYRQQHGRTPPDRVVLRLRQIATLATRPAKEIRSLNELTREWADRAQLLLGEKPARWARRLTSRRAAESTSLRADDLATGSVIEDIAAAAYHELATQRSTWSLWNVRAAVSRAAMPYRLVNAAERDKLIQAATGHVISRSVDLTPGELAHTPERFRRADGTSMFARTHHRLFTSADLLAAEQRLLAAGRTRNATTTKSATVERVVTAPTADGHFLADDQADAIRDIASSGRQIDVLVGPAGTGKTTTLAALRTAWEAEHGPSSVLGLAPSAAAADVLAASLGIGTDNTAKWLHETSQRSTRLQELAHLRHALNKIRNSDESWHAALAAADQVKASPAEGRESRTPESSGLPNAATVQGIEDRVRDLQTHIDRWRIREDQLIIVDESSLAGTLALDHLAAEAATVGAKVLLVGDWAQLASVDAGGAFGMLVSDRGDGLAPELTGVRRFHHQWERDASAQLRLGHPAALDLYAAHGRLADGTAEQMLDAAYRAWLADEHAGQTSLLIAADNSTVRELNIRARADRVAAGTVSPAGAVLPNGALAGTGDRIVTRSNDRRLATGRSWVKNGDTWTVLRHHHDGSLTVRRDHGFETITLPTNYVADHVDLAYATTAHRAQGRTVDTAHAVITGPTLTREILYVAMTRARESNRAYVMTDTLDEDHIGDGQEPSARTVLTTVLRRRGAGLSAHETGREQRREARSIARLAAEYDTIAREASRDRLAGILTTSGLDPELAATSEHYPALAAAIRVADAHGIDPGKALPKLAVSATADDSDPVLILAARLARLTERTSPNQRPRHLIAGLIPAAQHINDTDLARALAEREQLLEAQAHTLAQEAVNIRARWVQALGPPPRGPARRETWMRHAATVAAYRDRYSITAPDDPLGQPGASWTHRIDHRRATRALQAARELTGADNPTITPALPSTAATPAI